MRVECLLERFERETSHPVLSRIAGQVSDEQFLEVAGLDGPARSQVADDLLKLGPSVHDIHVVEIFGQAKTTPRGPDTSIHLRHVPQLLGPGCSDKR